MLRKIRIALAAVFFTGITLLLVGIGQEWFGWMAKLQFLPSCLALNFAVILGILLLTLVFGRLYCSVICPLGVMQDLFRRLNPKKKHSFSPERKWLRYGILVLSVVSAVFFTQILLAMLAPYSAYGRIVSSFVALFSGSIGWVLGITGFATLVLLALSAYLYGRAYCNNICPVGSALGLISRFSLIRPVIDENKCVNCGSCVKKCKASCIDGAAHKIDCSRCVVCFDCLENCKLNAISYKFVGFKPAGYKIEAEKKNEGSCEDDSRRKFLATTVVLAGAGIAAKAQNKRLDGGLADVVEKNSPVRSERLVPPGALSVKSFYDHCTACQLCVDNCPNNVLRPSTDLGHLLQPQMGYEKGYCRPECTLCSELCPAGAIRPIQREEKLSIRIGVAKVNLELCYAATGSENCGNCERHCPSGAIRMVNSNGKRVPVVNEEICIGCGACEFLCPVRPISAITIDGLSTHINKN